MLRHCGVSIPIEPGDHGPGNRLAAKLCTPRFAGGIQPPIGNGFDWNHDGCTFVDLMGASESLARCGGESRQAARGNDRTVRGSGRDPCTGGARSSGGLEAQGSVTLQRGVT
ncbi:hypothetical protein NFJ02_36g91710 [Pycnococcus provasolii]